MALLPYKPKQLVTCNQHQNLEDAILLMEAYMSAEAGIYLRKNLQKQDIRGEQNKGAHK